MSLSFHALRIAFIGLLCVQFGSCYKCFGSQCMCLDPSGCSTNCTNGFCQNKEFVCTDNIHHCSFDCQETGSCHDSRFYAASTEFYINCSSSNACNNVEIYCGMPPELPSQLTESHFNGHMQTCTISASSASMHNSYLSCSGNIDTCHFQSQPTQPTLTAATILDSDFDCSVHTGQCIFNCDYGCYQSTYSCTTPLDTQCQCNGCNHTEAIYLERPSTTAPASSTTPLDGVIFDVDTLNANDTEQEGADDSRPIFDLTDGKVSNLEILYYIIMGAGTVLVCCICLCVFMVCMVRSSVLQEEDDKMSEHPKSPVSTEYRVYGQTDSNYSAVDIEFVPSTNSSSLSKPQHRHEDDASSIEYEDIHPSTVSSHDSVHQHKGCRESSRSSSEMEDMSGEHNLLDKECKAPILAPSSIASSILEEKQDDLTTNMDEDVNHSQNKRNLQIKLTKPHNERHKSRSKTHKSRPKPLENTEHEDKNRLTPHSRINPHSASPMSPLSAISSSNPDPNEGTEMVYAESIGSVDSSEMNLKSKSRTPTDADLMPQPEPFATPLMSQQFEQIMADYAAHLRRGRSATQFAVMQQQLLFIQQHNNELSDHKSSYSGSTQSSNNNRPQLHMIKPSIHHCHTATVSNPTLPVIASDRSATNEYVVTPSDRTSRKHHGYTASSHSSHMSSTSDEDDSSSEQSDGSCSCSDCMGERNGTDHETEDTQTVGTQDTQKSTVKIHRLGDNMIDTACSSHGGSSSSSGSTVTCNDTQCSCQQCAASCVSSTDRDSCSSSGDSSDASSDSDSSSSSCETMTTATVRSEEDTRKTLTIKRRCGKKENPSETDRYEMDSLDELDVGSVDTDGVMRSYKRGNNKTMVIHEDMSTDTHSRQYTETESNLSFGVSTVGSTVEHGRFRTVVIHE